MKNKVLKAITWVASMVFIFSACELDSDSYIPHIICTVCLAWLLPFVLINGEVINGR